MRQLKKFGISPIILKRFYHAIIESVLTFSITVWFGRASYEEKAQLETLVRCASKIIGLALPTIESVYHTRCVHKSNIYINDLPQASDKFNFIMYADDTTLFRSVKSLAANGENYNNNFENEMNMELGNIGNWLTANKLSLNVNKSKYMIYSKSNKLNSHPKLKKRRLILGILGC